MAHHGNAEMFNIRVPDPPKNEKVDFQLRRQLDRSILKLSIDGIPRGNDNDDDAIETKQNAKNMPRGLRAWHPFTDFTQHKHNEWEMVSEPFEGGAKLMCSWPYFLKYWDTNFANIKIVSRSTDVCSKCHVFCNRLRFVRYETTTEPGADTTYSFTEPSLKRYFLNKKLDCSEEVVIAERETREVCDQNDVYAPLVMEPEAALSENNKILLEASLHVKQAADQRRVCNTKIKVAHQDYLHGIQHSERWYCLVVDYCQNAQLLNLGATQPGETYYMSPLTVPILGLVDCLLEGGSLDVFAYHEGIGWLKEDEIGGELTVLMDNCGGQNKNNHVLRLANLLVEAGYFKKNLYTFEQLCKVLGTNERIAIDSVKDGNFKHYKRLEDLFYKELKTAVRDFVLLDPVAPATGIKEIKQIELFTKWRKLVPAEFADIISP
eukprot:jgi/Psemu1/13956/gm1.13956_g